MGSVNVSANKALAWSFSRLTDFEKCPAMAHAKFVAKRPEPAGMERKHADRGLAVHKEAEDYVQGKTDTLPDSLKKFADLVNWYKELYATGIVEVEQDWAYDLDWQPTGWFDDNCWARIKLDLFIKHPDLPWEVVDYKTGKRWGNEVKHSQQGLLYAIAAFMRYPDMQRVRIRFLYVDEGKESPDRVYDRALVMRMLPSWDERARKFSFAAEWPYKPNAMNCRFCWYSPNNGGDSSCPVGVKHEDKPKPSTRS